jgi:hypothetical protein
VSGVIRSHDEDMERIRVEHENAMEIAREQTKREVGVYRERNKDGRFPFAIALVICVAVVVIFYIIVVAVRADGREKNKNEPGLQQQQIEREQACIQAGGAWLSKDLVVGDEGVCVFTSKENES